MELEEAITKNLVGLKAVVLELGVPDLAMFHSADEMIEAINRFVDIVKAHGIAPFYLCHCGIDFQRLGRLQESMTVERDFINAVCQVGGHKAKKG